ncbi:MAG TPA: hypothetical protein VFQ13_25165 [Anaerolineales bacterium]|nr:hypothetical protein [Anaerolineales bacterium]
MENWRPWFNLIIFVLMGSLGWMFGRGYHRDVTPGDGVKLPGVFACLFGKPNGSGEHNIRGIYWQIFVMLAMVSFALRDLKVITLQRAFLVCGVFLFSLPVLELLRYLKKNLW